MLKMMFEPVLLTKVVGIPGVKVHPEAATLNSSTEGLLSIHGRSDARHIIAREADRASGSKENPACRCAERKYTNQLH